MFVIQARLDAHRLAWGRKEEMHWKVAQSAQRLSDMHPTSVSNSSSKRIMKGAEEDGTERTTFVKQAAKVNMHHIACKRTQAARQHTTQTAC
jgi:hypothetical protein